MPRSSLRGAVFLSLLVGPMTPRATGTVPRVGHRVLSLRGAVFLSQLVGPMTPRATGTAPLAGRRIMAIQHPVEEELLVGLYLTCLLPWWITVNTELMLVFLVGLGFP